MARVLGVSAGISAVFVLLLCAYLATVLRLPASQWAGFAELVVPFFVVLFVVQAAVQRRLWRPLVRCVDARAAGAATRDELLEGFAALVNLPARCFAWGMPFWAVGGAVVGGGMWLRFESFTAFSALVMFGSSVAGGLLMCVAHFLVLKRVLEPMRTAIAGDIEDPAERGRRVLRMGVSRKLIVAITGVTVATVLFSAFLSQVMAARPLESYATEVQRAFLDRLARDHEIGGEAALRGASEWARSLRIADGVAVLDPQGERVVAGELPQGIGSELSLLRETGLAAGDSNAFDSPHVLSWRQLPDGRVLVAASSRARLAGGEASRWVFAIYALVAVVLAAGVALLLAHDVSSATDVLRASAERLSEGDLRRGEVFESEDELGELSRAFEGMAESLRRTMARVAQAADGVEQKAGSLRPVSQALSEATAEQVGGIERVATSMEEINAQVAGIAQSSQSLNESVEESSSSILELGASGEELNETASLLSSKVEEVSSSIEQMVRSVRAVSENTESLSSAAEETSSSMEEMASSLRAVDTSAAEAARLSGSVVDRAESGRSKVQETIAGMEAIQETTETAAGVIRGLHDRTVEIGAIVDVIDDVADETNLLALNAAIIAAQAGEHGKAFGVVADEIRDLAERVLASTKEIGGLIHAVQEESRKARGAIEQGSERVASGVSLSAEAGRALEEITEASRQSGSRIEGIVGSLREQAKAAGHVVELMERVRGGVDQIRHAASEQDRGNVVVYQGSVTMREVAAQVRGTTEEQARGSGRIRESVEGVREAVEQINAALQEQSQACAAAVEFLEAVQSRTQTGEEATRSVDGVSRDLLSQAGILREEVERFRV